MQNLVTKTKSGELLTDSLVIAELFGRVHKDVMKSLDKLKDKLEIAPISYRDSMNREQRMLLNEMTIDRLEW